MAQPRLGSNEMLTASISNLSLIYGEPEDSISQRVYALSEQIHRHYCMSRGFVNHSASRPDEHVAVSVLMSLAGADWFFVRDAERLPPTVEGGSMTMPDGTVTLKVDEIVVGPGVAVVMEGDHDETQS